jgi:hypothetical protein
LHTTYGLPKVPIRKNHNLPNGNHIIKIPIYGILFNPIKPEISDIIS